MTLREIDHVSFLVEHAQTFFAGEAFGGVKGLRMRLVLAIPWSLKVCAWVLIINSVAHQVAKRRSLLLCGSRVPCLCNCEPGILHAYFSAKRQLVMKN